MTEPNIAVVCRFRKKCVVAPERARFVVELKRIYEVGQAHFEQSWPAYPTSNKPPIDRTDEILVVGAGAMGSQIGMVCSLAGYGVTVQDVDEEMLEQAQEQLRSRMSRNVEKGRNSQEEVDAAFDRVSFTTDLEGPASEADFIIEAAVEKLDVKREIFATLDEAAPEHAILTTNSSTIVSSQVADATDRPDRVCNMHFSTRRSSWSASRSSGTPTPPTLPWRPPSS